ncbi:MAG: hypothetical protein E7351_02050 [Clostridiales bacterium]|nr:hypothetical protein [Clostridiales bacterium]
MLAVKIIFGIILLILYVLMMTTMIIFERDKPKNMIIWSIIFLLSQVIGYAIYLVLRHIYYKKKNSLVTKQREDDIYRGLISSKLNDNKVETDDELFAFNNLAFDSSATANNNYELIHSKEEVKASLIQDIRNASSYIMLEFTRVEADDFEDIKSALIEKAKSDVVIRLVHNYHISHKLIKELKSAGIRVYRFSKYNTDGRIYANLRNIISIDGKIAYLGNFDTSAKQNKNTVEITDMFLRIKGDVVQDINLSVHQDAIFASGKYIEWKEQRRDNINNKNYVQFVSNHVENDMELLIIKAICMAKKSIQLQLQQFIPTESIMSLLRFAINSNIDVRLMVPFKNNRHVKYFATRAYAKELALFGANVYLYDGYLRFNAIVIDSSYVIYGSYILDREHLNTSLQNIALIKDIKTAEKFNKVFDTCIDNSYRINNAKYMLLREKFFKNFV